MLILNEVNKRNERFQYDLMKPISLLNCESFRLMLLVFLMINKYTFHVCLGVCLFVSNKCQNS